MIFDNSLISNFIGTSDALTVSGEFWYITVPIPILYHKGISQAYYIISYLINRVGI